MDSRTVVAWVQVVAGALSIGTGYANWRGGRSVRTAIDHSRRDDGRAGRLDADWRLGARRRVDRRWPSAAFLITRRLFTVRDRLGLWMGLVAMTFVLVISVTELVVDGLTALEQALFAAVGFVGATLMLR